jgi:hypothetical protein
MDPGTNSGIANQFVRTCKAVDVANGRQNGHRDHHADPRQLHEANGIPTPCFSQALFSQLLVDFRFVFLDLLQQGNFLTDLQLLQRRDLLLPSPPFPAKQALFRQHQIVAVQQTLQPIAKHGTAFHQSLAV